eukprot:5032146-Amphidinium_carterae.1
MVDAVEHACKNRYGFCLTEHGTRVHLVNVVKNAIHVQGLHGIRFCTVQRKKIMIDSMNSQAYVPILEKNKKKDFTDEQKAWQLMRWPLSLVFLTE